MVQPRRSRWTASAVPYLGVLLVVVALVGAMVDRAGAHGRGPGVDFAGGLTSPRHLRIGPDGFLYVAEAGIGGDREATCEPVNKFASRETRAGAFGPGYLYTQPGPYKAGFTGRISRILPDGTRQTIADGLPSAHDGYGDALGPSDIAWIGRTMYVVIEGGGCSRGLPDHPAGVVRIDRDGSHTYVADISAFVRANPVANEPVDGPEGDREPDGVPHSLLAVGGRLHVVETNHNSVLQVDPDTGEVTRLHDLSVLDPAPTILTRHHGRFYLGGFDGLVQVYRHRSGPFRTFDRDYGPIVDMMFVDHRLFVLETFAQATPWAPDTGRVVRRGLGGGRSVVASELNFPVGMTRGYGRDLYVTTASYGQGPVPGLGRIIRIDLP